MSTRFEDRLLTELQSVVHANPAPVEGRRPVGRWVAASAAVAAGVTGFTVLGGGASPAFAVSTEANGDITVTIKALSDASGLERALAAHGVTADVTYAPRGQQCAPGRFTESSAPEKGLSSVNQQQSSLQFTISKGQVQAGQTLVVETSGGLEQSTIRIGVAAGPVGACHLVPAGAAPAGAVTSTYSG